MNRILVFAERMLPSTQRFITNQVRALKRFQPHFVGLIPAELSCDLPSTPILLTNRRSIPSRLRRESYRWTGIAPSYHARIGKVGAKLLHAHFAEGASSAVAISTALKLPIVFHLRGGAEMMSDAELMRHAYQLPYLFWRQRLWTHASLFLCVSDFIKRKSVAAGFPAAKLRVHYTGIDLSGFCPASHISAKDRNMVLYVGRLVRYKGADDLVRALHIVRRTHPYAHLVIIGEGAFLPVLKRLTEDLKVPCQFLGEQPPTIIRAWLEKARVFCGPSHTLPSGMSEAFGNVFTEAQAMGVPVVSYRHGGIPETMLDGQSGLLANEGDHRQLAAHLLRYLVDDEFWRRSREFGMKWVRENFDIATQTAKLERIYDEVIDNARPSHAA
jgi:colanic acid/amylovoran biosynthesis glycosyltransferase